MTPMSGDSSQKSFTFSYPPTSIDFNRRNSRESNALSSASGSPIRSFCTPKKGERAHVIYSCDECLRSPHRFIYFRNEEGVNSDNSEALRQKAWNESMICSNTNKSTIGLLRFDYDWHTSVPHEQEGKESTAAAAALATLAQLCATSARYSRSRPRITPQNKRLATALGFRHV